MRTKKTGLLTKIVVLALLIYLAISLLTLRGQIQDAQDQLGTLERQVSVQTQENTALADAIANSDDPEVLERVARDKGYVRAGERIMVDVAN